MNLPTAEKKERKKIKKAETGGFEVTLCLSRIERSTAEPKGSVVNTCRLREGNFENRRSPSLAATPVLSPGIARAAVWVGLGAVARSRGIGWRSGLEAVFGVYCNRHVFRDPFGHYYCYRGGLYNKD